MRVDYGTVRVLLTGDLNAKAQQALLDHYTGESLEFAADVVKACHHGSDDCSLDFLSAIVAASAVTGHRLVNDDKLVTPLVYSTEIARSVRISKIVTLDGVEVLKRDSIAHVDYSQVRSGALRPKIDNQSWKNMMAVYGLVNVRSDGRKILCATINEGEASWDLRTFESRLYHPIHGANGRITRSRAT